MPEFRQITVVGVGLVGGSFALAARKAGFQGRIVGCDNDMVLEKARAAGAIDSGHFRPEGPEAFTAKPHAVAAPHRRPHDRRHQPGT